MEYQDFKDSYFDLMNPAEKMFIEEIYFPLLGSEALDYVRPQMPFRDSKGKPRFIDFAVVTSNAKYAIEIDGWQYHAEGAISPDEFSDQQYRQNEIQLAGWLLLRFSWDHLNYEKEIVADQLLRAFRADDLLHPTIKKKGEIPMPNYAQNKALEAIEYYRSIGWKKGIAVLATGLGKTFLAAFDAKRFNGKTLFIVHKNEILQQAKESFELVWPEATTSYFNADEKELGTRVVFASKDTICREEYLREIPQDLFDYIIVDEVHHGQCATYLRIFRHFEPQFSLGLTATPDRMDRKDIFELYDYNKIYQMDQKEAIESGYLAGFKYYGLTDDIDYSKARHNGRRYNVHDLDRLLIIDERNEAIYDKYMEHCPNKKAIGFCVSIKHANRMADHFIAMGIKAEAVHSSITKAMREDYIQKFRDNDLTILFTCDLFNEGVDFPDVESLLFLRPTESRTIFTQQMGRGLRLSKGKHYVIVLDFIGNFKKANHVRGFLGSKGKGDSKGRNEKGEFDWPIGCEVHFDEDLLEMFKEMDDLEEGPTKEKLIEQYFSIKDQLGRKPKPTDINEHGRFTISAYNNLFGTWVTFLKEIGEATKASYHYHQGVHLGHLFFVVYEVGSGNFDGYLEKEKIFPSKGTLTKFGRQIRYKIWAAMEIGLLEDDRKPGASDLTYQNLTKNGKVLFGALSKHQDEMSSDFFEFRTDLKTDLSWAMIQNEQFYNDFFRDVLCSDEEDRKKLMSIFLGFMGIKHMCKFLFHVSQSKVINRSDLYNNYFKTPFIESYFEVHGIVQDSVEGAKRRLPFLVNILEACGIVSFVNRSKFQLEKLPLIPVLFSENVEDTAGAEIFIDIARLFYQGKQDEIDMDSEEVVQLKTWFGKNFLTDKYSVGDILEVDGSE